VRIFFVGGGLSVEGSSDFRLERGKLSGENPSRGYSFFFVQSGIGRSLGLHTWRFWEVNLEALPITLRYAKRGDSTGMGS